MAMKAYLLAVGFLALTCQAKPGTSHPCAETARAGGAALLKLHAADALGPDAGAGHQVEIDKDVTVLPRLRNPAARNEWLEVLEVWGHVYKGNYRMRMIYLPKQPGCVLVGQEILEWGSF